MSLFDRVRQKNKSAFQNEMQQENYAKHEKKQTTHPMHVEGMAFRYAYCTLVAMAADIDMPINGMEMRLLTSLMESINLDGGIKEVLLQSNNQGEQIRESLSVMITEDYQKDVLYTDMIIMCLADSNKLSLKEQLFIENMEKLLNLPASHTESLKEYIQMRVRCQVREAETFIDELPKLKSFAQRANQYITSIISVINEPRRVDIRKS